MNNILGIIASGVSGLCLIGSHFAIQAGFIPAYIFTILEFIFWGCFTYMVKDLILPPTKKAVDANGVEVQEPIKYTLFDFKKMAWLSIIFSAIIFIYTSARQLKDSLVIGGSAGSSGAAVAKILVPILSIVFQLGYIYASKVVEYKRLLYYATSMFLIFFVGFSLFCVNKTGLDPINQSLLPSLSTLKMLFGWMPTGLGNIFIGVVGNWPSILFYIVSECFGSILLTAFFWQLNSKFVNKSVIVGNNRMLMVMAQIASLAAGYAGDRVASLFKIKSTGPYKSLQFFMYTVVVAMAVMMISNYFLFETISLEDQATQKKKEKKTSVGILQIIKDDPKILLFSLLTVFYGLIVVFIEQYWKHSVKMNNISQASITVVNGIKNISAATNSADLQKYMAWYYRIQSRVSLVSSIFLPFILSKFINWTGFAITTPILILIGSILVFGIKIVCTLLGVAVSWKMVALIGTITITILKAAKYILFDSSREIYVKNQSEDKGREIKNIEGLISRYGKSGGAYLIVFLGSFNFTFDDFGTSVILLLLCGIMSIIWLYTITLVSDEMQDVEM